MKIFKITKKISNYLLLIVLAVFTLYLFGILIKNKKKNSLNFSNFKHFLYENMNNPIYSIWKKKLPKNQILFHNPKGNAQLYILGDPKIFSNSQFKSGISKIMISLQEKFQVTTNHATLIFENAKFNPYKDVLHFPIQKVFVRVTRANRFIYVRNCLISSSLKFSYFNKSRRNFLKLNIQSPDCEELNLDINSNLAAGNIKYTEVLFHTFFTFFFIILKFYYLVQIDHQITTNLNAGKNLSLVTLLIFGTFELILGFEQLLLAAFNFPLYLFIVIIGVSYFCLFFFIILKLISTVLRVIITERVEDNRNFNLRAFLIKTYFKAHLTILLVFYLSMKCFDSPYIYLFWTFSIIPQIISNACSPTRFITSFKNLISFYVITIFLAIYNHFYKYNFFFVNNNKNFDATHGLIVILSMIFFVSIIVIQETISPFFFLPKILTNKIMHDYFTNYKKISNLKDNDTKSIKSKKKANFENDITNNFENDLENNFEEDQKNNFEALRKNSQNKITNNFKNNNKKNFQNSIKNNFEDSSSCCNEENVCVICLISLEAEVNNCEWERNIENELVLNYMKEKCEDYKLMITPCNHIFHSSCLLVWMTIKMECPLCKAKLPSVC